MAWLVFLPRRPLRPLYKALKEKSKLQGRLWIEEMPGPWDQTADTEVCWPGEWLCVAGSRTGA